MINQIMCIEIYVTKTYSLFEHIQVFCNEKYHDETLPQPSSQKSSHSQVLLHNTKRPFCKAVKLLCSHCRMLGLTKTKNVKLHIEVATGRTTFLRQILTYITPEIMSALWTLIMLVVMFHFCFRKCHDRKSILNSQFWPNFLKSLSH